MARYGYRPRALALAALLALTLCCAPVAARPLAEIQRSGELRACLSPIHPAIVKVEPADCRDDCSYSGAAVEELTAFADTLEGVDPVFRHIDWDRQFWNAAGSTEREAVYDPALLASGECDVYPSHLTANAWREKKLAIVPLFRSRMMVIVNKAQKTLYKNSADLAGKTAAVEKDTSYHTWLQDRNANEYRADPIEIRLMDTSAAVLAVDAGEVDFTALDADISIWTVRHQLKNATVAFPVGPIDRIGWAFRKDDKDLQAAAAAFFADQKAVKTSAINRIWEQHFGVTLSKFETLIKSLH